MSPRSPLVGSALLLAAAVLAVGVAASAGPTATHAGPANGPDLRPATAGDAQPRVVSTDVHPRIVEVPNTTNYLMPRGDPVEQGYTTADVDVATAVGASSARLDGAHRSRTFLERYDSAERNSTVRLSVVKSSVADVERRVDRLDARQAELYRGYSNGTLSGEQLVDRLVRLDARATETRQTLQTIRNRVRDDPTTTLSPALETRIAALQSQLVVLPAPMSDRLAAAASGEASPIVTYVGGSEEGLVLATVDGDRFYRQATVRSAARGAGSTNFSEAFERVRNFYPWVYSGGPQFAPGLSKRTGIYRLEASHPQGTLTAYLSGSSSLIFHESQTLDPEDVPVYQTVSQTNASLNVTVTTTTETGPMQVVLRNNESGAPVNGTVFVQGEPVTTTGDDGQVWTVRPAGAFELRVVTDDGSVSVGRGFFFR